MCTEFEQAVIKNTAERIFELDATVVDLVNALEAVKGWYFDDKPIQSEMIDIVTAALDRATL